VSPVHAGIIEPGHFRFSVVGDTVLHLELRHFCATSIPTKGRRSCSRALPSATVLWWPNRSPAITASPTRWHTARPSRTLLGVSAPPRGEAIRLVGLELERMLAHIADVGALCGDVGFTVPAAYNSRIKESLLQASARLLGTRFWKGVAVPGGVRRDLSAENARALREAVSLTACDFAEMAEIVLDTPSVQNRFESTGILSTAIAREMAVVGPVARASGIPLDVRRDHPYGRYREVPLEVPPLLWMRVSGAELAHGTATQQSTTTRLRILSPMSFGFGFMAFLSASLRSSSLTAKSQALQTWDSLRRRAICAALVRIANRWGRSG
jgi:Ni,Fe-hydrogenase III large subunit